MSKVTLEQAYREAVSSTPAGTVILHTLQFSAEAGVPADVFVVHDFAFHNLTLEDGSTHTFMPRPFALTLAPIAKHSNPAMDLSIDNIDKRMIELIDEILEQDTNVFVKYRPFLSNDPTRPQYGSVPAVRLSEPRIDSHRLTARLVFPTLANRKLPAETYNRTLFPTILTA